MNDRSNSSRDNGRGRRRLLQAIAAGGGAWAAKGVLPAQWRTPVVDSLTLPAHAQTTEGVQNGSTTIAIELITQSDGLLDALVPAALAVPARQLLIRCRMNVTPNGKAYDVKASFKPEFDGADDVTDTDTTDDDCVLRGGATVGSSFEELNMNCPTGLFEFLARIIDGQGQFQIRFDSDEVTSEKFDLKPGLTDLHNGPCCKFAA